MEEIKVNALNEEAMNEVAGGRHYGRIEDRVMYKNIYCYKYRIGNGDTLSWIAQDFGFSTNYMYLANLNGITNPDKIYAGQIIYIPIR